MSPLSCSANWLARAEEEADSHPQRALLLRAISGDRPAEPQHG
jgi:hypothetical protein